MYRVFDNTAENRWDPYTAINTVLAEVEAEPEVTRPAYIIFCHQDIRLDQGHGYDQFIRIMASLAGRDPRWAIAGNCGGAVGLDRVIHVAGPGGLLFSEGLPQEVVTLDENLLIINPDAKLRCSSELSGFHMYGTDLCLCALVSGRGAYVVDFRVTHNSPGLVDERFYESQHNLQAKWNRRFVGALITAPCNTFAFSRFRTIYRMLNSGRAINYMVAHPRICSLLMAINRPFSPWSVRGSCRPKSVWRINDNL